MRPKEEVSRIANLWDQPSRVPTARATDVVQQNEIIGVSASEVQQILAELGPGETLPPQPFDFNWRALAFIPDSVGGYSRAVHSIDWERRIGEAGARLMCSGRIIGPVSSKCQTRNGGWAGAGMSARQRAAGRC